MKITLILGHVKGILNKIIKTCFYIKLERFFCGFYTDEAD